MLIAAERIRVLLVSGELTMRSNNKIGLLTAAAAVMSRAGAALPVEGGYGA